MVYFSELSVNEAMVIYGGEPTKDTSFGYDIAWYITSGVKWVVDLF
ncbi:MAG: hypothetical protein ACRC8J_02415 [Phocaeicola sp.]